MASSQCTQGYKGVGDGQAGEGDGVCWVAFNPSDGFNLVDVSKTFWAAFVLM